MIMNVTKIEISTTHTHNMQVRKDAAYVYAVYGQNKNISIPRQLKNGRFIRYSLRSELNINKGIPFFEMEHLLNVSYEFRNFMKTLAEILHERNNL